LLHGTTEPMVCTLYLPLAPPAFWSIVPGIVPPMSSL